MVLDAVGNPQTILLLGGTSEIGLAICERYLRNAKARIVLADLPDHPGKDDAVAQMKAAGAKSVEWIDFDGVDTASHPKVIDAAFARRRCRRRDRRVRPARRRRGAVAEPAQGGADRPDQLHRSGFGRRAARREDARPGLRPDHRDELGGRRAGAPVQLRLRLDQGRPGRLLPRPRRSVAAQSVFASWSSGRARCAPRRRSSTGRPPAPRKRRSPSTRKYVAELAVTSAAKGKELVWAPGAFRYVMMVLRHIPRPIFRKLPI